MVNSELVVGHRIRRIVADTSLPDESLNFADFICILDNGVGIRLPYDDETDDWFNEATPSEHHVPMRFPKSKWWHYHRRLWRPRIRDVLVPADPEWRCPDSSRILLESGWYLAQCSATPIGILPFMDIMPALKSDDVMVSIWTALRDVGSANHRAGRQTDEFH